MPELAASYAVGFLASLILTAVFYFLWSSYQKRPEAIRLQENLKIVGVYWSDREDRIKPWNAEEFENDSRKGSRALLATAAGFSFLSWVGFVFILILMVSYRYLARSRFESRLFASALAREAKMTHEKVEDVLREIRIEFPQA
jgi:predicted PurR-regulated permease PerM